MRTIKESSTLVIDDVGQEYDPTSVVEEMEQEWPEMTEEFRKIQR